jgi:RimJ/RimL family protein N-acetyltransferase
MAKTLLEGKYVNLRLLTVEDAAITCRWRNGGRAINLNIGAVNVNAQGSWIVARPQDEFNFMFVLKDQTPIGMLSLINIDQIHKRAEPARFLIGDEEKVKGIPAAVEAMLLLYKFAFDDLKLRRLYGTIASDNNLMLKWQRYLGMKDEGRLRDHYFINNHFQDAICLGILRNEYENVAMPRMCALISAARDI